jgi:hypothetical protein
MKTIRFHRIDNIDYGRSHGPWYKKFAEYCEQYFNVEWVNYAETTYQGTGTIQLQAELPHFGSTPPLSDADCIIENLETNKFVVLTFTEYFNSYVVHYLRSDNCEKLCSAHFSYHNIYHWLKRDNILHKLDNVSPWFFGMFETFDIDHYRTLRENTTEFNSQLFYKGSGQEYRKVINILHEQNIVDRNPVPFDTYLHELSTAKCGLSYYMDLDKYHTPFHHPGEFCYRDMEYMAVGTPFIRIEYKDAVYNGLIPNYHYISIPREYAHIAYHTEGNEGVAELIKQKYNEVINDEPFLNFVSKNGKEWIDKYARWPVSAEFTFKLTGLDKWI